MSRGGGYQAKNEAVQLGTGENQVSKVVSRFANVLPWPRGFQNGAILDALLTLLKSVGFRGHLKEV